MEIGYARVSSNNQELEAQRGQLAAVGCQRIFSEKLSGASLRRPELQRMFDHIRSGDTLLVTRLDRLARSTRDLLSIAERLNDAGAGLRSLSEPWADTTSPAGRMVMTVFSGIAEFERSLIVERTREGRKRAQAQGVRFGPKEKLSWDQVEHASQLIREGRTVTEVAHLFGVHRSTLYRALARQDA